MHRSQADFIAVSVGIVRGKMRSIATFTLALALGVPMTVEAQLPPISGVPQSAPRWWFTGGGVAAQLSEINDGRTNSRWSFGNDPLWQFRGAVERTVQENFAIGASVAFGNVDLVVIPRRITQLGNEAPILNSPALQDCASLCPSTMDLSQAFLTFRAGTPRRGFGSTLEGGVGVTSFRNLRRKEGAVAIEDFKSSMDFTAVLGGGLHYGFTDDFHVTLAQEFGIGFHSKDGIEAGSSSTFRPRITRFGLRYGFSL
jgi:hypothetical protein